MIQHLSGTVDWESEDSGAALIAEIARPDSAEAPSTEPSGSRVQPAAPDESEHFFIRLHSYDERTWHQDSLAHREARRLDGRRVHVIVATEDELPSQHTLREWSAIVGSAETQPAPDMEAVARDAVAVLRRLLIG